MKFGPTMALLLAVCVFAGCEQKTAPVIDFTVKPSKPGGDVKLSKAYPGKPMVVYLWATWCGPCRQFAPSLNELADKYQPKGVEFLAISGENLSTVTEFEKKEPHRMTVMIDPYASATAALESDSLPTIVILDKEHRPIWGSKGVNGSTQGEMAAALDSVI